MQLKPNLDWLVRRPIAHRGLHGPDAPENSSAAFAAAIAQGYAIECDIQSSSDGEAMVFHDDTLDRMTREVGAVDAMTAQQLRRVTLGHSPCTMQSLAELLEQVSGRVPLVIEIKSHWDGDADLTLRAVEVLKGYTGAHALMSFDPRIVERLADAAPHAIRGIVADRVEDPYYDPLPAARRNEMRDFTHLPKTRPHFVSFDANGFPFEPVTKLRAAGTPVICWTITSEGMASRALAFADQITFEGYLPR